MSFNLSFETASFKLMMVRLKGLNLHCEWVPRSALYCPGPVFVPSHEVRQCFCIVSGTEKVP